MLILLQGLVTFLPYHREWIIWLQRVAVLIDLAVIWYFWVRLRSDDDPILRHVPRTAWMYLGGIISFCVVIFSVYLATFPGEWVDQYLPGLPVPTTWRPHWSEKDDWTSLQDLLFKGATIDEVSGRPRSVFSNRLILTDQSFVVDPDKLDKVEVNHSFRGRDLRQAVLNRADLRKADFTGAMLNGASFQFAKLQNARFSCESRGTDEKGLEKARWPDDGCTWLQGASFFGAQMQGAMLPSARLQGANLAVAKLQGANLNGAQMQGADLSVARLHGADLGELELQGASLYAAKSQGANLGKARLQGATLSKAEMEGTNLTEIYVWRARGSPKLDLTELDEFDPDTKPWEENSATGSNFTIWLDDVLKGIPTSNEAILRLSGLNPLTRLPDILDKNFWESARSRQQPQGAQREKTLAVFLAGLACSSEAVPYVAQGLIRNGRIEATGMQVRTVADTLRKGRSDPAACPGVRGLTDEDWALLERLVAGSLHDTN